MDLRKMGIMNGETEQGIERFEGVLEWRPRPTPGCSAIEEEEEYGNRHISYTGWGISPLPPFVDRKA
jgi:hypothetical protein